MTNEKQENIESLIQMTLIIQVAYILFTKEVIANAEYYSQLLLLNNYEMLSNLLSLGIKTITEYRGICERFIKNNIY